MRILIADDHDLVRDALIVLLEREAGDFNVTPVENLDKALEKIRTQPAFDLVIVDLRMPGMKSVDTLKSVIRLCGKTPVVLMSGQASAAEIESAYDIGIKGYLPKTLQGKALANALRLIISGERYVPWSVLEKERKQQSTMAQKGGVELGLSDRELEVLRQLFLGHSNKEVARALGVQETTVKLHLSTLFQKMGARSRLDLVIKALQHGICTID